jgi:hypothetical protein
MISSKHSTARVSLSLRVHGASLDRDAISALLQRDPSHFHKAGDARVGRGGRHYAPFRSDLWELEYCAESDSDLAGQLVSLLATLDADSLGRLYAEGHTADLFAGVFLGDEGLGSFSLPVAVMTQLSVLGLSLEVSIYA